MLDDSEADDKIIAVLVNDPAWGEARDIAEVPPLLVERLLHYFNTYKLRIGEASTTVVRDVYGFERAARVVEAAWADYAAVYSRAAE
jgi:inorganic pyrophosphatase